MTKKEKKALFVAAAAGLGYYLAGTIGLLLFAFIAVAGL